MTNKQRTLLLTGGSGRVGQILLNHFLNKGDTIITTVKRSESLKSLSETFQSHLEKQLFIVQTDLTSKDSFAHLFKELKAKSLSPTHLINNARDPKTLALDDKGLVPRANFLKEYELQVVVPYELSMYCAEQCHDLESIINVSSLYALVAVNHQLVELPGSTPPHYSVAKAGLIHLTKELAVRLAHKNINVNAISLGGLGGRASETLKQTYESLTPLKTMLEDKDVPESFDFLLSKGARAITGHNLVVDGGWTIV